MKSHKAEYYIKNTNIFEDCNIELFENEIVNYIQSLIDAKWNDERIRKWLQIYASHKYSLSSIFKPCVDYSIDTDPQWILLFEFNGYKNTFNEVDEALKLYPNDIDFAYNEMISLKKNAIMKKIRDNDK